MKVVHQYATTPTLSPFRSNMSEEQIKLSDSLKDQISSSQICYLKLRYCDISFLGFFCYRNMWTVRDRTKALRLEERVYITPPPLPRLLLTVKEVQKTKKNSFVLNIKQHNKHITKKMFLSLAYYKNLFFKNSDTFRLNKNKLIISPSKPNAATSFNTSTHILYEF